MRVIGLFLAFVLTLTPCRGQTISVLTYNLGLLRAQFVGDLVKNVNGRAKVLPAALVDFAEKNKVTVLALQEVWENDHAKDIAAALEKAGYEVIRPAHKSGVGISSGLVTAFKKDDLTLSDDGVHFVPFENAIKSGAEVLSGKGALSIELSPRKHPTVSLDILNTHLQVLTVNSETGVSKDRAATKAHQGQSELLKKTTAVWKEKGHPFLVVGDFNVGPALGKAEFDFLIKALDMNDVFETLKVAEPTWDRENPLIKTGRFPNDPSDRIDHILIHNGKSARLEAKRAQIVLNETMKELESPLSDHYGAFAEVELAETP